MTARKTAKRVVKYVGFALLAVAVLLLAVALFVQTPPGKSLVASTISSRLSNEASEVRVEGISGILPTDFSIEQIVVADREGEWLRIEDASLRVSGRRLLEREIVIHELLARNVELMRLPQAPERPREPEAPEDGTPLGMPQLDVERFEARRFALSEDVAGQAAAFAVEGYLLTYPDGELSTSLRANRIDGRSGRLRADVDVSAGFAEYVADIRVEEDAGGLLAGLMNAPSAGPVTFWLTGRGPLNDWSGALTFSVEGLGELGGVLTFEYGEQLNASAELEGHVVSPDGVQVQVPHLVLDVEELPEEPSGRVEAVARYENHELAGETGFRFAGGRLTVTNMIVSSPDGTLARGDLVYNFQNRLAEGEVMLDIDDLGALARILGIDAGGSIMARAELFSVNGRQRIIASGRAADVFTARVNAESIEMSADLRDVWDSFQGEASISATGISAGELIVSNMSVRGYGSISELNLDGQISGSFREPIELETGLVLKRSGDVERLGVRQLSGSYDGQEIRLTHPAEATRQNGEVIVEPVRAIVGSGALEARGVFSPASLDARLEVAAAPLSLLQLVGVDDVAGSFDLDLQASGSPREPQARITAAAHDVQTRGGDILLPGALVVSGEYENELLSMRIETEEGQEVRVDGALDLPVELSFSPWAWVLREDDELKGRIAASVDLGPVIERLPLRGHMFSGRLDANLAASGTARDPVLMGDVRLTEGRYENLVYGTVLNNISIRVLGNASRLTVEEASAQDGGNGSITMTGFMEVSPANSFPLDLSLQLDNAELVRHPVLTATFDGPAGISGSLAGVVISGRLEMPEASFTIAERRIPRITELDVTEINRDEPVRPPSDEDEVSAPSDVASNIALDLRISSPSRFMASGRGLESEWEGSVQISGTLAEPVVFGSLSVVRGRFNFLGRRFNLAESGILLDGSMPPDPYLDISAETEIAGMTARLTIVGPLSSPELALQSDPPQPPDEILSQLLFRRSQDRITPFQALRLAQGLNMLRGGQNAFDILSFGQDLLRIDRLDIRPDAEDPSLSAITVGKYLSDRIYVEGESDISGREAAVSVELELTPSVRLETEAGPGIREGVQLNWQRDY